MYPIQCLPGLHQELTLENFDSCKMWWEEGALAPRPVPSSVAIWDGDTGSDFGHNGSEFELPLN